jgi:type VI secretion system protein ImpH
MKKKAVAEQLFDPELACLFEPFQAVRVLELLANNPPAAGWREVETFARFRANVSMAFPPSLLAQVLPPADAPPDPATGLTPTAAAIRGRYKRADVPTLIVNFFGLFGPQGALPLVYTRTLCELDFDRNYRRTSTRTALRDWMDLFNNRLSALLYRAWQKYRLPVGYQRSVVRGMVASDRRPTDKLTQVLMSVVGLGVPGLRDRLRVDPPDPHAGGGPLARIDDLALIHYAGAFARRRPGGHELEAILANYFALPARVIALTGQWLNLPPASQTRLVEGANASLGVNAVAGEQIWDVNSKFRIRIGPLRYTEFVTFLPDPTPIPDRKGVFLLSQLTRLYVGPEFDFEVQLVLFRFEVPDCVIQEVDEGQLGIRLGWNTWLPSDDMPDQVDDVMFDAPCEVVLPAAV